MATPTKSQVKVFDDEAIARDGSDETAITDVSTAYGGGIFIKAVNGSVAPGVQGEVKFETGTVSDDVWYQFGANLQCSIDADGEYSWGPIQFGVEVSWIKTTLIAPTSSGSGMTVNVEINKITSMS